MKKTKVAILNNEYFVTVLWGDVKKSIDFVNKRLDNFTYYDEMDGFRGKCFCQHGLCPIIVMNTKKEFWSTLAHEAIHAIDHIWSYIGETSHNEVYAHSVAAVIRAVEKNK